MLCSKYGVPLFSVLVVFNESKDVVKRYNHANESHYRRSTRAIQIERAVQEQPQNFQTRKMSTPPSQTGSLNNDKDISPSINSHAPISSASCMQPSREAQNSSNPNADPVPSSPMSQSSEDAEEITRIPRCDWDGLQSRFSQTMEEKSNEENEIRKEFESLTAVSKLVL